jgi:hypothetical protein
MSRVLVKSINDYWWNHYRDETGCALCGNSGELIKVNGTKTYCICPNGQHMRYHIENKVRSV